MRYVITQRNSTFGSEIDTAIKHVTAAVVRALSQKRDIVVSYTATAIPSVLSHQVKLPLLVTETSKGNISLLQKLRGAADSAALYLRYHDDHIHHCYEPETALAKAVYDALERSRVEAIGTLSFQGVAVNIHLFREQVCQKNGYQCATRAEDIPIEEAYGLMLLEELSGQTGLPVMHHVVQLYRQCIDSHIGCVLTALTEQINNQNAFAATTRHLIALLGLEEDGTSKNSETEQQVPTLIQQGRKDHRQSESRIQENEQKKTDIVELSLKKSNSLDSRENDNHCFHHLRSVSKSHSEWRQSYVIPCYQENSNDDVTHYHAYSTQFDLIAEASELCDLAELDCLRVQLDQKLVHLQNIIARLANRLQRQLLAQKTQSWEFDLEEGLLDSNRLARIVTNPIHPLSFKREKEAHFLDTIVTLLIDNSGSMRGHPITIAAITADILTRTLERCGVKVEVLGFTTAAWKGGRSRTLWIDSDKPSNPGRLNDLCHLIYKDADVPWRRARRNFGLMLRDDLLKENIDGEALLWAYRRLIARYEQRRILLVISDGAPVDDSTLSANPQHYLERHLLETISWIENRSLVELIGIGIGHDVTRYYSHAVTLTDAEELSGVVLDQLITLFKERKTNKVTVHRRS